MPMLTKVIVAVNHDCSVDLIDWGTLISLRFYRDWRSELWYIFRHNHDQQKNVQFQRCR